jgi:hypothetical protein
VLEVQPARSPPRPAVRRAPTLEPGALSSREVEPRTGAILSLSRSAGNAAVAGLLAHTPVQRDDGPATTTTGVNAPPPVPNTVPPRVDYVFLLNVQKDNFYANAAGFFKATYPSAIVPSKMKTLDDVISTVNAGGKAVRNLFIVSHANEEGNLGFSLNAADVQQDQTHGDHKLRTEFKELKDANATPGALTQADVKLIDSFTKVEIKGCNIGRSQRMLDALGQALGGQAEIVAPTHKQGYRMHREHGKTVFSEEFDVYFLEESGIVPDKKPAELAAAFAAKYPSVPAEKWPGLRKHVKYAPVKRALFDPPRRDLNPPADDAAAAEVFFGIDRSFPKAGHWTITYQGRSSDGTNFTYSFHAERPTTGGTEFNDLTRSVPVPPSDADLLAKEKDNSGRPDATFEIDSKVDGRFLVRNVLEELTTWSIEGTIVDASGPAHPPETDPTFYGHHQHAPQPPPPPPNKP